MLSQVCDEGGAGKVDRFDQYREIEAARRWQTKAFTAIVVLSIVFVISLIVLAWVWLRPVPLI
jgi:hypothetical protein